VLVSGKAKDKETIENLKKLGALVVEDIEERFDVMVADDKLVRNVKLLQAINIGAKIVKLDWIKDSVKKKEFVDISNKYLIIDKAFEK